MRKSIASTRMDSIIPASVKEMLRSKGKDPESDLAKPSLYEGIFSRIKAAYPLDYYWFWTTENRTWQG